MIFSKVFSVFLVSAALGWGAVAADDSAPPVDPLVVIDGPCATNPCLNDGHCVPSGAALGYFCRCAIGFYGDTCDEEDEALTMSFLHVEGNDVSQYPTGFEEDSMQVDPICDPNPCENTGHCISSTSADAGYVCLCSEGWTGENCKDHSTRHLRGAFSEEDEDDSESRLLQSGNTQWACIKNGYAFDTVSIWWGHTRGDASWACNDWNKPYCGGKCTASAQKLTRSDWYCYGLDPMIYVAQTNIWWGHTKGDATWACNAWYPSCQNYGGCLAKNVFYTDSTNRYNTFIKCSGNGGACAAVSTGSVNFNLKRFNADGTDEKVEGCGGGLQLTGGQLSATLSAEPSASLGLSFSTSESFYGWEGCCAAVGEAMQSRGYLSDGWYCEKDTFNTGIWLKGKAHWL
jgi:EGF-like domain